MTWHGRTLAKDAVDLDVALIIPLGEGIPLLAPAAAGTNPAATRIKI